MTVNKISLKNASFMKIDLTNNRRKLDNMYFFLQIAASPPYVTFSIASCILHYTVSQKRATLL